MSSILKALKKLEEEKARHRTGEINLSREILNESPRRKARPTWPWAVAGGTIALLLVMVAILLVRGPAHTPQAPASQTPQTRVTPTPPPETTLPAEPVQPQATGASPRRDVILQKPATPATTPPSARIPVPLPPVTVPDNRPALPETAPPVTGSPARVEPSKKRSQSAEPADAAFTVSGIAWNKDSADRLAVVNGQPLTTGSAVGGALVEEILPDRVRFSQGGKTFEVPLGKAGKTH
jgi:general secretion pathway protein B